MDLERSYARCAEITRREAKNFYFAFLSLPRPQRRAVYALYAFCREADDVADSSNPLTEKCGEAAFLSNDAVDAVSPSGSLTEKRAGTALLSSRSANVADSSNPLTEKCGEAAFHSNRAADAVSPSGSLVEKRDGMAAREALRGLRARLRAAGAGRPETERDLALADTISRFGVDVEDLAAVVDGVEMDLDPIQIETDDELFTYCDRVASAVGLATLPILTDGVPPTDAMRDDAVHLGRGMQFVNILRDVGEDLGLGRIYLPRERLERFRVDADALRRGVVTEPVRALLADHAARARAELSAGRRLLPQVPRSSRSCLWLLSEIYGRILERIVSSGYEVFARRASLPTVEKLWLVFSAPWRRR